MHACQPASARPCRTETLAGAWLGACGVPMTQRKADHQPAGIPQSIRMPVLHPMPAPQATEHPRATQSTKKHAKGRPCGTQHLKTRAVLHKPAKPSSKESRIFAHKRSPHQGPAQRHRGVLCTQPVDVDGGWERHKPPTWKAGPPLQVGALPAVGWNCNNTHAASIALKAKPALSEAFAPNTRRTTHPTTRTQPRRFAPAHNLAGHCTSP